MNSSLETFGTQRASRRHGRADLERWMADYRASVGDAGELCVDLLKSLYDAGALDKQATDRGLELLEILEPLAPDPVTISSALVHIANLDNAKRSALVAGLPVAVRNQLDDLEKLKHYESGQSIDDTERSAEGLRRLLLLREAKTARGLRKDIRDLQTMRLHYAKVAPNPEDTAAAGPDLLDHLFELAFVNSDVEAAELLAERAEDVLDPLLLPDVRLDRQPLDAVGFDLLDRLGGPGSVRAGRRSPRSARREGPRARRAGAPPTLRARARPARRRGRPADRR